MNLSKNFAHFICFEGLCKAARSLPPERKAKGFTQKDAENKEAGRGGGGAVTNRGAVTTMHSYNALNESA